jgi:hypothetical protein
VDPSSPADKRRKALPMLTNLRRSAATAGACGPTWIRSASTAAADAVRAQQRRLAESMTLAAQRIDRERHERRACDVGRVRLRHARPRARRETCRRRVKSASASSGGGSSGSDSGDDGPEPGAGAQHHDRRLEDHHRLAGAR